MKQQKPLINDIKRGAMANSLVLHDLKRNPIDLKGLFDYMEDWFLKSRVIPTHMGLIGDNAGKGMSVIQFNNGKRRLEKFNFEGFRSIGIHALPHNWDNTSDYLFYAGIYSHPSRRQTLILCWDDQIIPFEREYVENLAKQIDPYIKPAYGYGYQREFEQGPSAYCIGGLRGIDSFSEEADQITKWGNEYGGSKGRYRTGLLRDIYPVNFISEEHIMERVGNFSLQEWINLSPNHGELRALNDHLWSWHVPSQDILLVRESLLSTGILLSFQ